MQIRPVIATVVGHSTETVWGQVLQSPAAFGVLEVETEDPVARQHGVGLLTKLSRLLVFPPKSLGGLAAIADSMVDGSVRSLLLLVPVGAVLYLVVRGSGRVYLKRGEKIATLVDGMGEISGNVAGGDSLLLATRGFLMALSTDELGHIFDHLPPADVAEKLTVLLHGKQGGEGGAALIFQVSSIETAEETVAHTVVAQARPPESARRRDMFGALWRRTGSVFPLRFSLYALIALASTILFIGSVVLGIQKQVGVKRNTLVREALTGAQRAFDEGMAILDLNPVKGRERLTMAKETLAPLLLSVPKRSKEGRQVIELYEDAVANLTSAMHITQTEPELFYDVSLLRKGAVVSGFALSGDMLGIVDYAVNAVYAVSVSNKSGAVVLSGERLSGATAVASHGDKIYILVPSGIHEIRTSDNKVVADIVRKDAEWGTISSVVSYGGNLYLLDREKSRIWKYVATENGFSERREYLNPDTLPDLSKATGMAIDGSVWVGTPDGKIVRFVQGRDVTFLPKGVEPAFGGDLFVYTSDSAKNAYVLDRVNKRIVVLDKDGLYLAQYVWEGSLIPTQMVVSEAQRKILLLAEGKIYALTLK